MPLVRFPTPTGLVYTIDLSKIADRANPRTVEAPIHSLIQEPTVIDWGDGTTETVSSGTFHTHTYADGAGDVFTVVIRSATGNLPISYFTSGQYESNIINLTKAVTSVDHFGGRCANDRQRQYNYVIAYTSNLTYCDPRIITPGYMDLYKFAVRSGLEQPIQSFCFDFIDGSGQYTFDSAFQYSKIYGDIPGGLFKNNIYAVRVGACFYGCTELTSIGEGLFDNNHAIAHVTSLFNGCTGLQGAPYKFWGDDGTTDRTRFPNMTGTANCYTDCTAALRAQVPTAYGGTMTIS